MAGCPCDSLIVLVLNGSGAGPRVCINNAHFPTLKQVDEQLVNSAFLKEKKKSQQSRNAGIADG